MGISGCLQMLCSRIVLGGHFGIPCGCSHLIPVVDFEGILTDTEKHTYHQKVCIHQGKKLAQ